MSDQNHPLRPTKAELLPVLQLLRSHRRARGREASALLRVLRVMWSDGARWENCSQGGQEVARQGISSTEEAEEAEREAYRTAVQEDRYNQIWRMDEEEQE